MQIEALLKRDDLPAIEPRNGTCLLPDNDRAKRRFRIAVEPAMRNNFLNADGVAIVFTSSSLIADVTRVIAQSEVILADVSLPNADLFYILGLCHGLGRCPILIAPSMLDLPFDMPELRCVEYRDDESEAGLIALRQSLERVIRVFLAASRATRD